MNKHQFYYEIKDIKNLPLFIGKGGTNIRNFIKEVNTQFNDIKLIINYGYFTEKKSKKKFCEIKKGSGITHLRFRITYSRSKIDEITKFVINNFSNIEQKNLIKKKNFGTWIPKDLKKIGLICGRGRENLKNIIYECEETEGVEIWYSNKNRCFNIKCNSEKDLEFITKCLESIESRMLRNPITEKMKKEPKKEYKHSINEFPSLGQSTDNTAKIESKSFWSKAKDVNLPGEFNLSDALFKQREEKRLQREIEEKKLRDELNEFDSDDDYFSDDDYCSDIEIY